MEFQIAVTEILDSSSGPIHAFSLGYFLKFLMAPTKVIFLREKNFARDSQMKVVRSFVYFQKNKQVNLLGLTIFL